MKYSGIEFPSLSDTFGQFMLGIRPNKTLKTFRPLLREHIFTYGKKKLEPIDAWDAVANC